MFGDICFNLKILQQIQQGHFFQFDRSICEFKELS